jgi:hypothetical protein
LKQRLLAATLLAAAGASVAAAFVAHAGAARVADVLGRMGWGIAAAVVLEGARVVCETAGTRALQGTPRLPLRALARAQLAGYAVCYLLPAGRTVAEAVKAAMLARHAGRERVVGVALANQAMALVAVAIASGLCAAGATGRLAALLAAHAAVTGATGLAILATAWRRMPAAGKRAALAGMLASRACQAGALAALLRAAAPGARPLDAVVLWGLHLVGASLGDVVPAQLGIADAALGLGAASAHLDVAAALAVASAARAAQLVWVCVGAAVACGMSSRQTTLGMLARGAGGQ